MHPVPLQEEANNHCHLIAAVDMTRARKTENYVYFIAMGVILVIPVALGIYYNLSAGVPFGISSLAHIWLRLVPFLLLFAVHNWLLCPLALSGKNWQYVLLTVFLLVLFGLYLYLLPRPDAGPSPLHGPEGFNPFGGPGYGHGPHRPGNRMVGPVPPGVMQFMLGMAILGLNWGVKSYFESLNQKNVMEALEKENLDSQLSFLRYQISPHFFMNTLNNIHALVDIDPDKAKESIVELSKLMRYILYEGDKPTIPLDKETEFLRHYISLMRMRYAEGVDIRVDLPPSLPDVEVPPLVFVSFVENAFKHGVSYEDESFIHVSLECEEGLLRFVCTNSRHSEIAGAGGVGNENTRRRLDLLYGNSYMLDVQASPGSYDVLLEIPLKSTAS